MNSETKSSRERIVEAALACFARKGYNKTTMDDIAAESGLSKGSLYWHFESKEALFLAGMEAAIGTFDQMAQEMMAGKANASQKLRAFGAAFVRSWREMEGFFNVCIEFWVQSEPRDPTANFWREMLEAYKRLLVEIVEEGVRGGEFRSVDADQLVWAVMAAYDGLGIYSTLMPDLDLARISEAFIDTLLQGLETER
jgi:AcrR family transcriptional regulator